MLLSATLTGTVIAAGIAFVLGAVSGYFAGKQNSKGTIDQLIATNATLTADLNNANALLAKRA